MSNTTEFVRRMFAGDEDAAAAALAELTDPHAVAEQVRRQMGVTQALDAFKAANADLVGDRLLAQVADLHLADVTQGRAFHDLQPAEAAQALAAAGDRTRRWLKRVAPNSASEPEGAGASSIIARMKQARGQI